MNFSQINTQFGGKRVVIWGLGLHGGGVGAAKFFSRCGSQVLVTDLRDENQLAQSLTQLEKYPNISYVLGRHNEEDFLDADLVVRNPAIRPHNELYIKLKAQGVQFATDIGIFMQYYPGMIVGITGSKGKSTLTKLVYDLLAKHFTNRTEPYNRVQLGGNIRISVLELLKEADDKSIAVVELSSFMLEQSWYAKKSPHIAFITNIFNEHLDWHGTLDHYIEAKKNIARFQKKGDVLIAATQCLDMVQDGVKSHILPYSGISSNALSNLADVLDIPDKTVYKTIEEFKNLEGRQEFVAEISGIRYINDTTATHPAASSFALEGLLADLPASHITAIVGGVDKGFGDEVATLAKLLEKNKIRAVLLPGTLTDRLIFFFSDKYRSEYTYSVETMQAAVVVATHETKAGGTVILTPGGASFNLFTHEFHRGKVFVDSVLKLKEVKTRNQKKFIN
ncbi:MAG: Mur ligase family protein [Patescibacteria group bacterium]